MVLIPIFILFEKVRRRVMSYLKVKFGSSNPFKKSEEEIRIYLGHDDWTSFGSVLSKELEVSDLSEKLLEVFVDSISEVFVARSDEHRMLVEQPTNQRRK